MSQTKDQTMQLEQREAELEQSLATLAQKEVTLRADAQEKARRIRELRADMETADAEAEREIEGEIKKLQGHREAYERQKQECTVLQRELTTLKAEQLAAQRLCDERDKQLDDLGQTLTRARQELADTIAEREKCHALMLERSKRVKQVRNEKEQRLQMTGGVQQMRRQVQELEDELQRMSTQLVQAQELTRQRRAEEDEMRAELQKLKDAIRATGENMAYQVEHGNLQFETIQRLEEQKQRFEGEVEVLTLGLHEAEQRNEYLQKENALMQQQVKGLYEGSLQEWAADVHRVQVEAEVARYKEEIEVWKQKAEQLRKDRQQEGARLQKQNEETVQSLRERILAVQSETAACETKLRRREAALAKCKQRGEAEAAPASAVPGLVVPQRPLPIGHRRRKALLIGVNYVHSHAPLKGCINDIWNIQCLLRYTLQYSEDQLRMLLDGADGRPPRADRAPTMANIQAGLQWLVAGAQPGDNLLLVFAGYGAQHPREPGSDQHEAYLVPSDFAADLPADFFSSAGGRSMLDGSTRTVSSGQGSGSGTGAVYNDAGGKGYRLVPMLEVNDHISRVPPQARVTIIMDCCYSVVPGVAPQSNFPPTFARVERGRVDYAKLRDFISRPRFLELPVLPLRHTPRHLALKSFPSCWLHCFSACKLHEWCAEFPIEGTVQGAFSWAFIKALAGGHFHCGVYQFQRMLTKILADLKIHFKGVEQTPLLQLSQGGSMQDVVLGT